ncbi:MAG: hypothetical protein NZM26_04470 [Patescibacteria group bacterium]|nr:hypothetical protein [Patescibacteria group bacterium]
MQSFIIWFVRHPPSPLSQEPHYDASDLPSIVEALEQRLGVWGIRVSQIKIDPERRSVKVFTDGGGFGEVDTAVLNNIASRLCKRCKARNSSKER